MSEQHTQRLQFVIEAISEITDDNSVPRNIKLKLDAMVKTLNDSTDLSIKVHKVLNELDEISEDINLQSHTRMQLMNIASSLESIH